MKYSNSLLTARRARLALFPLLTLALFLGASFRDGAKVSANHPVYLEGNCDSPVPGTTLVSPGTCGDYDGDGRIGTAEDTDGADRIFGTLTAAVGPGTGAAAGTGANNNGMVMIVTSGRFAESVLIGNPNVNFPGQGSATPGNVTIEAAPGVIAVIDAVLQGDPAGGNTARQQSTGILINYEPTTAGVILRNLVFRNWKEGVGIDGFGNHLIDNCRFENNNNVGLSINSFPNVVVTRSQFTNNGRRIPVTGPASPGDGIAVAGTAPNVKIADSTFSMNVGAGIRNSTGVMDRVTLFKVATFLNGTNIVGPVTIAPDHNYGQ